MNEHTNAHGVYTIETLVRAGASVHFGMLKNTFWCEIIANQNVNMKFLGQGLNLENAFKDACGKFEEWVKKDD